MNKDEIILSRLASASGKIYETNTLIPGELQYMDRAYRFCYVPELLIGCTHIKTHGNDKLIREDDLCVTFEVDRPVDVWVLFADKFPVLPEWLKEFERTRNNVTRQDSKAENLKGYFSLYRKRFSEREIVLRGCSPKSMLAQERYVLSGGENYCMYTVALSPPD